MVRAWAASRTEFVRERPTHVTIAKAAITSATPTIATAVPVTRIRSRRRTPSIVRSQSIARAPHGLDRRAPERTVDLRAQVSDVDLDDVEVAVEAPVPAWVDDVGLAAHGALAPQQVLEQCELAPGE